MNGLNLEEGQGCKLVESATERRQMRQVFWKKTCKPWVGTEVQFTVPAGTSVMKAKEACLRMPLSWTRMATHQVGDLYDKADGPTSGKSTVNFTKADYSRASTLVTTARKPATPD